jgi:hypothetical protein
VTSARQGVTKTLWHVPAALRNTLTYDWGKEMAEHEQVGPAARDPELLCQSIRTALGNTAPTRIRMAGCASLAHGNGLVGLHDA